MTTHGTSQSAWNASRIVGSAAATMVWSRADIASGSKVPEMMKTSRAGASSSSAFSGFISHQSACRPCRRTPARLLVAGRQGSRAPIQRVRGARTNRIRPRCHRSRQWETPSIPDFEKAGTRRGEVKDAARSRSAGDGEIYRAGACFDRIVATLRRRRSAPDRSAAAHAYRGGTDSRRCPGPAPARRCAPGA